MKNVVTGVIGVIGGTISYALACLRNHRKQKKVVYPVLLVGKGYAVKVWL